MKDRIWKGNFKGLSKWVLYCSGCNRVMVHTRPKITAEEADQRAADGLQPEPFICTVTEKHPKRDRIEGCGKAHK